MRQLVTTVVRKLPRLIPVLLIVTIVTFSIMHLLPGDPARAVLGNDATPEQIEAFREAEGLDRSLPVQYVDWITDAATGDFGTSVRSGRSVLSMIAARLPVSVQLMVMAQLFALLLAIPWALISAYRAGTTFDKTSTYMGFGMISVPPFILGIVFIFLFAVVFDLLPATGYVPLSESITGNLRTMIMPTLALGLREVAVYMRLLRSDLVATMNEDYLNLAKSKGLPVWYIMLRHALRPSCFSLITLTGLNFARLIGGSVIVEVLFALPGVGRLIIDSIFARDLMVVQTMVLLIALMYVIINLIVDMLYAGLDPRVRETAGRA